MKRVESPPPYNTRHTNTRKPPLKLWVPPPMSLSRPYSKHSDERNRRHCDSHVRKYEAGYHKPNTKREDFDDRTPSPHLRNINPYQEPQEYQRTNYKDFYPPRTHYPLTNNKRPAENHGHYVQRVARSPDSVKRNSWDPSPVSHKIDYQRDVHVYPLGHSRDRQDRFHYSRPTSRSTSYLLPEKRILHANYSRDQHKSKELKDSGSSDSFSDISSSSCSPISVEEQPTAKKMQSTLVSKAMQSSEGTKSVSLSQFSASDLQQIIPHMNDIDAKYEKISQIGEGTYGKVYKGKVKNSPKEKFVAMKKVRMECEKEGFPLTATREIKILSSISHRNIIPLLEIVTSKDSVYMVFDYMEYDLAALVTHTAAKLEISHVKYLLYQVLCAIEYLHDRNIFHRDIKSMNFPYHLGSNILLSKEGEVKLADFGLARSFLKNPKIHMTSRVITLWYRPPELLLGASTYDGAVDMWSVGCLATEWILKTAPFQGTTELSQLMAIFSVLGSKVVLFDWSDAPGLKAAPLSRYIHPPKEEKPRILEEKLKETGLSDLGCDLIAKLLDMEPSRRISAREALRHPFFEEYPVASKANDLPMIEGEWHEYEMKQHQKRNQISKI